MTVLGFINRVFLQWFFIRLAKVVDEESKQTKRWFILRWVVPLTGWGNKYKFLNKKKHYKKCPNCGEVLSEWYVTKTIDGYKMWCHDCGKISPYRFHQIETKK